MLLVLKTTLLYIIFGSDWSNSVDSFSFLVVDML